VQKGLRNNWFKVVVLTLVVNLPCFATVSSSSCCIYNYYERDELYKNNFIYFLENGILKDVDYYIVIHGKSTVAIPKEENITVFYKENKGFDFGAYGYALSKMNKDYNYYFFINSSVKGPYLKDKSKKWTDYFIALFNKDVKVVGTSINVYDWDFFSEFDLKKIYGHSAPFAHVQSMFFAIDHEYLTILKGMNFFNEEELNDFGSKEKVIAHKEFGLSQHALQRKFNINCILSKYKNIDYRTVKKNFDPITNNGGDPYYKNSYFGATIDPFEVIFFKNARFN